MPRWLARLAALLLAALFLVFLAGEVFTPHSGPPGSLVEWAGIALFCTACLAPLGGWWKPLAAALVSLAALGAWAVLVGFDNPAILAIVATPGALLLARLVDARGA